MVRKVRGTNGTKSPRKVRKVHGTNRPWYEKSTNGTKTSMVRKVYGTKSLAFVDGKGISKKSRVLCILLRKTILVARNRDGGLYRLPGRAEDVKCTGG